MHLKRNILAALVLVCLTVACILGSKFQPVGVEVGSAGLSVFDRKETIYFWYADDSMTNFFNSAAVSFGEKHNVRVIPVLKDDSEYLEAVNQTSLHSSRIPDVYVLSNESLEKAYLAGLASPVRDRGNVCTTENFPQTALSAVTYHDEIVAYPLGFETSVLVYNKTYLNEWAGQQAQNDYAAVPDANEASDTGEDGGESLGAKFDEIPLEQRKAMTEEDLVSYYMDRVMPATVDDILYVANTFDVPEGVDGVMRWDVSDIFYNYWIVGEYMVVGGDNGDDEANININNQEAIECLEVYKALNQFFYIESETVTFESVVQDFIDGKIVFTIATTDIIKELEQAQAEGRMTYEYGFAVMPAVSSKLGSRSLSVTSAVAVNGYSENKELANQFAAYLVTECSGDFYKHTGKLSANLSAEKDNSAVQVFMAEYADSVPLCKMMSTSNFWIQLEVLFSKVWNGEDTTALVQQLAGQIQDQINAVTN